MKLRILLAIQALVAAFTRKILGPHVCALVVKTDAGLFAVDPQDYGVGGKLRRTGKYGLDELDRLVPHIREASRILVVGAHIGTLAIPLSRLCREVIAIEANPRTYELLAINTSLNRASNCRTINIAASDKDESIGFLLSRANSGGSKRVPKIRQFMYYYDKPEQVSVRAVRLDDYLDRRDFDIVVMDIEGSEYFALAGMQEILANCRLLVVEFLPHHLRNVSGITVDEFLSVITPHFSKLSVPSRRTESGAAGFAALLTEMYELDEGHDGILFSKA
jgi:FkbM family methyltransferase